MFSVLAIIARRSASRRLNNNFPISRFEACYEIAEFSNYFRVETVFGKIDVNDNEYHRTNCPDDQTDQC